MAKRLEFNVGQRFGKRTILGEIKHIGINRYVKCKCDCGVEKRVNVSSLSLGKSKSCGCSFRKHGMTGTRLFTIFDHMKQRCNNPNNPHRYLYGGRGVKILWNSFVEFYNDMHESYEEHVTKYGVNETTIDRIDTFGNYCKENCRWATRLEQGNNLSSNCKVVYKGKTYNTLKSLCKEYGIKQTTLNMRIKHYGLTLEEAIETPVSKKAKTRKCIEYEGKTYDSIAQLCRELGIKMPTILNRVREKGISLKESIDISLNYKTNKDDKDRGKINLSPYSP